MATIFAATSLELEPEKKKELIDALGEIIGTIFKTYSLYYTPVPAENVSEGAKDQMTFFVFVPPYMEIDRPPPAYQGAQRHHGARGGLQGPPEGHRDL